jgi:hypothetical protein
LPPPISPPRESLGSNGEEGQGLEGSDGNLFAGWLLWLFVGLAVLVALLLLLLLGCMCFRRPRRLCVLLCTHPDPTLGPLYVPDDVRREYAMELGLNKVPVDVWSYLLGRRGPPPTQLNGGIGVHTLPSEPGPGASPRRVSESGVMVSPRASVKASPRRSASSPRLAPTPTLMPPPSPCTTPRAGPATPASMCMSPLPPSLIDAASAVSGGARFLDSAVLAACPFDAMQPEKPVGGGLDGWDAGSSVAMLREHRNSRGSRGSKSSRRSRSSEARSHSCLPLFQPPPSPTRPSLGQGPSADGPRSPTSAAAAAPAATTTAPYPDDLFQSGRSAGSAAGFAPIPAHPQGGLFLPPAALFLPAAALTEQPDGGKADGHRRSAVRIHHRRSSSGSVPSFRWCRSSGHSEGGRASSPTNVGGLGPNSPMPRVTSSGRHAAMPCGYPPGRAPPGGHPPCGSPLGRKTPPLPEPLLLFNAETQVPACGGSADRSFAERLKTMVRVALQPTSPKPMTAAEAAALWELRQTLSASGDGTPAARSGGCTASSSPPDEWEGRGSPRSELGASQSQSACSDHLSGYGLEALSENHVLSHSHSGGCLSPRSEMGCSAKSGTTANTGTTATDCRGALASLRMLAQHLPPASHHRSPSDPTAAAAALAASLHTIGVREPPGGGSHPAVPPRCPPPLPPYVGAAPTDAVLTAQLQAAAAAQLQGCTHPAAEVHSRPPRDVAAAAAAAADHSAELEAAYAAGMRAATLAAPQPASAPQPVVKPLRTPIGLRAGCGPHSGASPSTGAPGPPPEGWRAPRLTLPATSLGPTMPGRQPPSPRHSPRNRASDKQPAALSAAGTEAMKRVQRTRSMTALSARLPTVPQSPTVKATAPNQPTPDASAREGSVPESDDGIMMV